jgi:hypothetical protein
MVNASESGSPRYPGAPRWVKVFVLLAVVGVVVFVIMHLAGGGFRHGHFGPDVPASSSGTEKAP